MRLLAIVVLSASVCSGCATSVGADRVGGEPMPAGQPSPAVVAEEIAFGRVAPQVGEVTEEIEERRLVMTLSDGRRIEKLERTEERRTVLTVLAVDDGLAVKARVTYARHRHEPPTDQVVLEGRTFLIERTDRGLAVLDGEGAPVDEPARAFVAKDFARFGESNGLGALPTSPLRVGARAPSFERSMRRELAARAPGQLKDLQVKLSEIRDTTAGTAGVFIASFVAVDPRREVTMRLRAEIVIRARDGAILSSVIRGPMEMGGAVLGEGTVRMVSEYTYR